MSNKYFNNSYNNRNNEAELYRKISHEVIEQKGIDFIYIKRTLVDLDEIFGEDSRSKFVDNETVTLYIENYTNWDGVGEIFSKFGFTPDHQLTLLVERLHLNNILGQSPAVGDLIYHEHSNKFFEIVHVNEHNGFFQFNSDEFLYKFQCKLFEYSYETINTSIEEIDELDQLEQDNTNEEDQFNLEKEEFLNLTESNLFQDL